MRVPELGLELRDPPTQRLILLLRLRGQHAAPGETAACGQPPACRTGAAAASACRWLFNLLEVELGPLGLLGELRAQEQVVLLPGFELGAAEREQRADAQRCGVAGGARSMPRSTNEQDPLRT